MADTNKLTHMNGINLTDSTLGVYLTAGSTDPVTLGQITYVTGTGFRAYGNSGVFTIGAGGGGGTGGGLESAYSVGGDENTILMDEGAITFTDALAGALNTLELVKSGAGSGNVIDMVISAAHTGNGIAIGADAAATGNLIDLDCNLGIAAQAIFIDNGGTARTGTDVLVTCDSTDAHTVFDVNASGSGAAIGFWFHGSYNGSPAGYGFKVTLDNGDNVDTTPLYISAGTGARNVHVIELVTTGTGSGNMIDISMDGNGTGDAIYIDMNTAVAEKALYIDAGAGTRTDDLISVKHDGNGNTDVFNIDATNTGSGAIFDINMAGNGSGAGVFNVDMDAAVGAEFIYLDAGAGARTADLIYTIFDGAGNADFMAIVASNTGSGALFDINMDGLATGQVFNVDMNAAVGAAFLLLDAGAATRTEDLIDVTFDGDGNVGLLDVNVTNTGSGNIIDIDIDGIHTGNIVSITYGTAASTGDAIEVAMGTNLDGSALTITGAGNRTDDLIKIDDSSAGSGMIFDINISGAYTGNIIDIIYSVGTATGDTINIDMATNVSGSALVIASAGNRTDDLIKITDGSAGNSQIFDINIDGNYTGNVLDVTFATGVATGDAIKIVMGTNVTGGALVITGSGVRTDDFISVDSDNTGAGIVFDLNLSGAGSGNCFDLTYSVGANTGNAISLAMGTNVAGMAIDINTSATGTNAEGSAIDIAHDGNLAAGANLVQIISTGNHDATSDVVYIEQSTGAGTAGTNLVHLLASGANVEALYIEAGLLFQSVATATPGAGNGETLPCTANVVHYDPNGGSRTGVIVQAGLKDGQKLTITNIADAAETVTMAAAGTSNVALGTACVITRYMAVELTWCAATSLWYNNIVA